MKINLVSWNLFGNSLSKINENYSDLMYTETDCANILLIQEAGSDAPNNTLIEFGSQSRSDLVFWCNSVKAATAQNDRCTTSIFRQINIEGDFSTFEINFQRKEGERMITAKRPMLILSCSNINIATIHAIANDRVSPAEIKAAYDYLLSLGNEFILMGDFNCTKDQLEHQGINRQNIKCPLGPTQRSGRTLDFALVSDGFKLLTVKAGFPKRPAYTSLLSDHIPIYTQFTI